MNKSVLGVLGLVIIFGVGLYMFSCSEPEKVAQQAPPRVVIVPPPILPPVPDPAPVVVPPPVVVVPPVVVKPKPDLEKPAYAKAAKNKARYDCLTALFEKKVAGDIKAGKITDAGNLRQDPVCL